MKEILILGIVQKVSSKIAYNTVKDNIGLDLEEILKKQEEKMANVEQLKSKFEEIIRKEAERYECGRLVVFIDDLDRLNPEVAVELLEVIKLFMDVEKCIFVLAIDYEVVVSGVRRKYGQNVSEEKCRSFFDKIIQLPFRLPVESYNVENLIRNTVHEDISEEDIVILSDFVGELLGSNPRAYKRLANSFFLIKCVNESHQIESDLYLNNLLIFGSLCVQMCVPKFYQMLVSITSEDVLKELRTIETEEQLTEYLEKEKIDLEMNQKVKKNVFRSFIFFNDFLDKIQKRYGRESDIFVNLSGVLQQAAITGTTASEVPKRAEPVKVNKIIINGQELAVNTPTEAIVEAYRRLLGNDMQRVKDYRAAEEKILTDDINKKDSYFRNKRELFEIDGIKIYIGLSSSSEDKKKYTAKLCNFMKNRSLDAHVVWKYNDELVFDSDAL